jgi:uncharacterized protein (TIGR03790 family)
MTNVFSPARRPPGFLTSILAACAGLILSSSAHGAIPDPTAEGPQAVVIYNTRLQESHDLAWYYAAQRGLPTNHVLGLDLPTDEAIGRQEFQDRLQRPLLTWLVNQGLFTIHTDSHTASRNRSGNTGSRLIDARVRYLTLCYGVPVRILPEPGLIEANHKKLPEPLRRNEAAIDSELAILPSSISGLSLTGPITNPVYGRTNAHDLHPTNGVLMVGRIDGPDATIARGLIDKAIAAETNGLWGRAYFDLRGATDPNFQVGERWLETAANIVRRAGYQTIVDTNPATFSKSFPLSHVAFYAGWYDDHVSGPFTLPSVEFMPGAIAYHLHSFSAVSIRTPNQRWVGPLLAKGATATFGYVAEPYLQFTVDLSSFWPLLVGLAFSFGEATTVAQPVLSWQTTVVGDPLYRPFGRLGPGEHIGLRFLALHHALLERRSPLLPWSMLQVINFRAALGENPATLINELSTDPNAPASSILQEKLGELLTEQGKLSSAIEAYHRALALPTSPQQRIRLTLTLADLLGIYTHEPQALDLYHSFLKTFPDYPDTADVYRKMLPLARRLDRQDEVARIQAALDRLTAPAPDGP